MTHDQYSATFTHWAESAETRLVQLCDAYLPAESRIGQAARYSLLGGGKRIRAVLTLAACELAGASAESALDYACALEMLHCYSLIHDDLPCMDNDDFRRGKPSCHKQFGEDIALLAADALVTAAFEVIANAALPAESRIQAASVLSCAGGARGMLFGQELDKIYEQEPATEEQLRSLHAHKTGALIIAATDLGCAVAGAAPSVRQALNCYAAEVGLVFQIVDDILDVTSTTEQLGKPVHSDEKNEKTTYVTLKGIEQAHKDVERMTEEAIDELKKFPAGDNFLEQLLKSLVYREK